MSGTTKVVLAVVVVVLAMCVCLSVICIGAAGVILFQQSQNPQSIELPSLEPLSTLEPFATLEAPSLDTPEPVEPEVTPTPFSAGDLDPLAPETLRTIEDEIVPINDAVDLAQRLKGITGVAPTVEPPAQPYKVGDTLKFWVTNTDTDEQRQINATLRYGTDVVLFWIEEGVDYSSGDLRRLADTFTNDIYPTDRKFFGSEWSPGIDGDPRLYVLYVSGIGESIAGYFSSQDQIHPEVNQFSNAHEMFVMSADNVSLGEDYIYGTMAHEFQHMIHFSLDRNEESWVNEGFSMLAELLNNYDAGGFDYLFVSQPDLQLNTWPADDTPPHYGAAYLFMSYFLSRFGDESTQALVADPANGMDSVDAVLQQLDLKDESGSLLKADEVFADWTVANYLYEDTIPGKRFNYSVYPDAPKVGPTETIDTCPVETQSRDVAQYGADYIQLTCSGEYTLTFEGATEVPLLPEKAYSGSYAFWSNLGDESDMTLTREFDFSAVTGAISLRYRTWFDIEQDYDYVYLVASVDGETWDTLKTPSGTDTNPTGANYGWGYTGPSDGWVEEEVDLSAYAGKKVQLRFEYVTDAAVNGHGMLLDDISVDAIEYGTDFEADEGGWQGDGFVRVADTLPQSFQVTLIKNGDQTTVEEVALNDLQQGSATIRIGGDVSEVIVVVSGTTRFTIQRAGYRFSIR